MSNKRARPSETDCVDDDFGKADSDLEDYDSDDSDGIIEDEDLIKEEGEDEEIQIEFELFDPKEKDFHALKIQLEGITAGKQFPIGDLADYCIRRWWVGSSIKITGNEDDIFGFSTVINLHLTDEPAVAALGPLFVSLSPDSEKETVQNLLDNRNEPFALFVNERYESIPVPLISAAHSQIAQEISLALEEEKEMNKPQPYEYELKQFIMISPVCFETAKQPKKKGRQVKRAKGEETMTFIRPEEEIINKYATKSFEVNVPRTKMMTFDGTGQISRVITLITSENLAIALNEVASLVSSMR
mmetsp:Transcript_38468/g.63904  ORF Transcript_38468/g.63904 Transcript_38468/m.63904 type:complete len:301 (-) Transcript_38468:12-914(-)